MIHRAPIEKIGLSLLLITSLYLADAARSSLSSVFTAEHRVWGPIRVEVAGSGFDAGSRLRLKALLADGRSRRFETMDYSHGWNLENNGGLPASLIYKKAEEPAVLEFSARRFVAVIESNCWSGTVRIRRGTNIAQIIDVTPTQAQCSEQATTNLTIEDPAAPPAMGVFYLALGIFSIPAYWFGPWRKGSSGTAWLVFFLTVLHLLYWVSQPVGVNNDSAGYLGAVRSVLAGVPDYFPPGYGVLLLPIWNLAGAQFGACVTLLQHGMIVIEALWLYLLFRDVISERLALSGAVIVGAVAPVFTVSQGILSEAPTGFAMVGSLFFAVMAVKTHKSRFAIVAGVLTGWAGVVRGVPLPALAAAICVLYLVSCPRREWKLLSITGVAAAGIFFTPILWCGIKSGQPQLTSDFGLHLFNRVVNEQKVVNEHGKATQQLLHLLNGKDPTRYAHWEFTELSEMKALPEGQIGALMGKMAIEGISKDPLAFVTYTLRLCLREFLSPVDWIPIWADTIPVNPEMESSPPLPFTASTLEWRRTLEAVFAIIWPVLVSAGAAGILAALFSRHRYFVLALACVPVGYMVTSAGLEYFNPRFIAPVVPWIIMLAMVFLSFIADQFRRLIRSYQITVTTARHATAAEMNFSVAKNPTVL